MRNFITILVSFSILLTSTSADTSAEEETELGRYAIEGRVFPLSDYKNSQTWQANTMIHVNGGEYIGFLKKDGSFAINNVPSGSYVVEVVNPEYEFEPVRVEINSKGKFRARKVNYVQTSTVVQVPYPLRLKALGRTKYFHVREQWRVTDFLFNPMIIMMILPLFLVMILPRLMNDPETKKDLEEIQSLTKFDIPEMSDVVTNLLSGSGSNTQQNKKAQKVKKRQ